MVANPKTNFLARLKSATLARGTVFHNLDIKEVAHALSEFLRLKQVSVAEKAEYKMDRDPDADMQI